MNDEKSKILLNAIASWSFADLSFDGKEIMLLLRVLIYLLKPHKNALRAK